MAIFNSYVKLPEGNLLRCLLFVTGVSSVFFSGKPQTGTSMKYPPSGV